MSNSRILVVDDDDSLLQELVEMFRLSGYEAEPINAASKVVVAIRKYAPAIVLLDMKLAGKTVFQVAYDIRHQPDMAEMPIIAMTGHYIDDQYVAFMKESGINDYIFKPFQPLDVISKLENYLRSAQPALNARTAG
jgi:two-component system sensor histidine kinase ChiS